MGNKKITEISKTRKRNLERDRTFSLSVNIISMWGVLESREPIKGEFAKKLIEEMHRMLKLKKEGKDLHFVNKERETYHNIIKEDDI